MESSIIRILLLVALFFLLSSDYSSLLKQFVAVVVDDEDDPPPKNAATADDNDSAPSLKLKMVNTVKNSCLPKLICELNAATNQDSLSPSEISLLNLIRDTTISTTAEITSKYHFAAHMGQLIAGLEGHGCHNFYPDCPLPGFRVSQIIKSIRLK